MWGISLHFCESIGDYLSFFQEINDIRTDNPNRNVKNPAFFRQSHIVEILLKIVGNRSTCRDFLHSNKSTRMHI